MTDRKLSAWSVVRRLVAAFRSHSFATDGAWVVATQIAGKGTSTLLSLLLARRLSVPHLSAVTYLFATAVLLSSYLAAGLPLAISRITAEGRDQRMWSADDRIGAILVVAGFSSVAAVAFAPLYVPWLLSDEVPVSGALMVTAALVTTWAALAQAGMYGAGQFRAAFPATIVGTLLMLAVTVAALRLDDIDVLIVGNIAATAVPAMICTRHLYREGILSRRHWTRWPGRAAVRDVLATTLPGLGFSVIYASMNWLLVRTLVERQATPEQFNQYAIGLQWFSLVLFVPLAFGQVLFPKFIQKSRTNNLNIAQIVVPPALTFGMVLAFALIGAVLTPLVSWIYGSHYTFTPLFIFTIILAAALSGTVTLLGSFVMATRGFGAWLLINLASGATALLLLWLLPVDTAIGAASVLCMIQLVPIVAASVLVIRHRADRPTAHGSREEVVSLPPVTPVSD